MGHDFYIVREVGGHDVDWYWDHEADLADEDYFQFTVAGIREVYTILDRVQTWEDGDATRVKRRDGTWEETTAEQEWKRIERLRGDSFKQQHDDAVQALICCTAVHGVRLPGCKFGSNDGWIISPGECQVLAAKCREAVDTFGDDIGANWQRHLRDFAAFCDRAAAAKGFQVW